MAANAAKNSVADRQASANAGTRTIASSSTGARCRAERTVSTAVSTRGTQETADDPDVPVPGGTLHETEGGGGDRSDQDDLPRAVGQRRPGRIPDLREDALGDDQAHE